MRADGNIKFANYQSENHIGYYLSTNGYSSDIASIIYRNTEIIALIIKETLI